MIKPHVISLILHTLSFSVRPAKPRLSVSPSDSPIISGTSLSMTCSSSSVGDKTYTFMKGSTLVYEGRTNPFVIVSTTEDTGMYSCKVTINGVESRPSNKRMVTVVGELKIVHFFFHLRTSLKS